MTATDQQHEALESAVALFQDIYRGYRNLAPDAGFRVNYGHPPGGHGCFHESDRGPESGLGGRVRRVRQDFPGESGGIADPSAAGQEHKALAVAGLDGLLQRLNQLDGSLQGLAATLA